MDCIRLRGARENNLKNLDLDIPRGKLVVISGVSGSGKSSLLFDTIYAEGQRRYVESLSTYTRQFLERLRRPELDSLEGIGPAVAIRQKNTVLHSRSTVATYTEIADFMRLLFARAGTQYCPSCGREVRRDSPAEVADYLLKEHPGRDVLLVFPFSIRKGADPEAQRELLLTRGYTRVLAGGKVAKLETLPLDELKSGQLQVLADRIRLDEENRSRLAEAVETSYREDEGRVAAHDRDGSEIARFAEGSHCPWCEVELPEPGPAFFSFQHSEGACPRCRGYGNTLEFDESLVVPDPKASLDEGALAPWASKRFDHFQEKLLVYCRENDIPTNSSFRSLPQTVREKLLYGKKGFKGVVPWLEGVRSKGYKKYARFFSRRFMTEQDCLDCKGSRLRPDVASVRLGDWTLPDFYRLSLGKAEAAIDEFGLGDGKSQGVDRVLEELRGRLRFLVRMGLHYLTMDRLTRTLSGGEFQRIHLANALGSHLTDTVYALDEPTVGLHARDTERLMETLEDLREKGNSVLVVEHDLDLIARADQLLDMGPGSGASGGEIVYQGPLGKLPKVTHEHPSVTLRFLSKKEILVPGGDERRKARGSLKLDGASLHNLKNVDVEVPLGQLVCVSGVSGSGKTSLVSGVLVPALRRGGGKALPGDPYTRLRGAERVREVRVVDQSPLGKSPRSNPATYIGAFQFIREIFASMPDAASRRMSPTHFSFNSKEGRCKECNGLGSVKLEMVFMADLFVPCESCLGSRFRPETLDVRYKGRNIAEVLALTVDEAIHFFSGRHALGEKLWMLHRVGLGYLPLGQGASSLSGGESQRLKIARELAQPGKERYLYVLDEPTVGLHPQDVRMLLAVFQRLLKAGHSLLVVEHNLQVLLAADHLIDMGPEGGDAGGRIVAQGSPEEVVKVAESLTGQYLAPWLKERGGRK